MSLEPVSAPPPPAAPRSAGLAVASLVLGILALCLSFLIIGGILGLIGVALGWAHLRRAAAARTMAGVGMALSVLGIIAAVALGLVYVKFYEQVRAAMDSAGSDTNGDVTAWEGVPAPDFTVTTLEGKTIKLSELKGKRVVVDFWATWCPPCVKEIPHLIRLHKESSRDVTILGISSEEAAKLRPFVKKHKVNYPIASGDDLPAPYASVQSIPTTFFIDRRGIIQNVLVGYHDFDDLKANALQKDYEGEPKAPPSESAAADLKDAEQRLKPVPAWSLQISGASALTAGEWEPGAAPKILVADQSKKLHVIGVDGVKGAAISIPEAFQGIEIGRHKQDGPRLAGYKVWGKQVMVVDRAGKTLWTYKSSSGVDGAHWGDFDGDGTDELVVGMNGGDGLHALSADGKRLWQHSLGNVWNQAIVPATAGEPARIFATEAGGTVKVFDAQGKLLRTLRPGGQYVSPMTAARIDGTSIQVIAGGPGKGGGTMAFDEFLRKIAWSSSTGLGHGSWRGVSFAHGDVDGDGREDWCFLNAQKDLVLATARGERLASVPSQQGLESLALIRAQPNSRALLVTLKGDTVQCHRFE